MNPLIRRRLPPSVRSLLTDIGPKEEWTDPEPDTVTRDGIVLPARGAASGQEEFLKPAETQEQEASCGGDDVRRDAVCMLCKCKPSCYTCPRCNLHYCGLACYRSPGHSACSEEFYKESVLQELKDMGTAESEGRRKMQEILVGLRQKAERTHGGMGGVLRGAGIVPCNADGGEGEAEENVQVVELLSRLAEFQQSGSGSLEEIEATVRKLERIGAGEAPPPDAECAEADLGVADRLSALSIDELSEEELWAVLDSKEKEHFMGLMKEGALGGLVPLWKPWWEEHEQGGSALVQELEEEAVGSKGESSTKVKKTKGGKRLGANVPQISAKIPKLSSLCANPSPLIGYGLVNALYGYTFTLCLLNNDTDSLTLEFCDVILSLSEGLGSGRVFSSVHEALNCGEALLLAGGHLDKEDPLAPTRAVEAVAHIMTGRNRRDATGYCLAALSQLRSVLSQARKALSKEGDGGEKRQKYFLAGKKCEFFQAWALENTQITRTLANELWNEHSRRETTRSSMDKAKTVVEENLKKRKSGGTHKLIEELSK